MTSKEIILNSVRRNRPAASELPDLDQPWTTYADRRQQFIEVLQVIGGNAVVAPDIAGLNEQLRRLPHFSSAQRVASLVPGVGRPNVDLSAIDSPHALAMVDVAILPGEFAVAENAAVWVTDREMAHRVVYFLCQHLVLVVPADAIVHNMHEAYVRLTVGPASRAGSAPVLPEGQPKRTLQVPLGSRHLLSGPVFGVFISGPSKTADIEQTLVIGAHGPRSLTVCLAEGQTGEQSGGADT